MSIWTNFNMPTKRRTFIEEWRMSSITQYKDIRHSQNNARNRIGSTKRWLMAPAFTPLPRFLGQEARNILVRRGSVRSYSSPFRPLESDFGVSEVSNIGYDTGAFFYWAGLRYSGLNYMSLMYARDLPDSDDKANTEITWIDEGMSKAGPVLTGLEFLFPQFIADYGSWRQKFVKPTDIANQDAWLDLVFAPKCRTPQCVASPPPACDTLTVEPDVPFDVSHLYLERIAARCVEVKISSDFQNYVELDVFAYVNGDDQHRRLDSLHLSGVLRKSGSKVETCEQYSASINARTWPPCVVKPFLKERGDHPTLSDAGSLTLDYDDAAPLIASSAAAEIPKEAGATHVRLWNTADYTFKAPGTSTVFALSNVAPTPQNTIEQDVVLVVGVRTAKIKNEDRKLGAPESGNLNKLPPGMGEILQGLGAANAAAGEIDPAQLAGVAMAAGDNGYARYGIAEKSDLIDPNMVSIETPVLGGETNNKVGAYNIVLSELPPLGATGVAKAMVFYTEGALTVFAGDCNENDGDDLKANIVHSNLNGVRFRLSTPMAYIDTSSTPPKCRQWKEFEGEFSIPFGWRLDHAKDPRDVVTPGIHAYVERYLAVANERGLPTPAIGPFPGREPEVSGPAESANDNNRSSDQTNDSVVIEDNVCDCGCDAIYEMLEEAQNDQSTADRRRRIAQCMQTCMPAMVQCKAGGR